MNTPCNNGIRMENTRPAKRAILSKPKDRRSRGREEDQNPDRSTMWRQMLRSLERDVGQ